MKIILMLTLFISCLVEGQNVRDEADKLYLAQKHNKWYADGEKLIKENLKQRNINKKAKGVVLFLGDGMGVSTVTSTRILDGQLKGKKGESNVLSWETFPNVAFSKTYNTNAQIADSAGTATAFLTGVKTFEGAISVSDDVKRGTCTNVTENSILSILEMAEIAGLSTGIVTTARVTHATPAASYAHVSDRNYEDDSKFPKNGACNDLKDIARQMIEFPYGDGIDVILGGGRRGFLPNRRKDKRNLIDEWEKKSNKDQRFKYIQNREELKSLSLNDAEHVLGLFHNSHMDYAYNRRDYTSDQPSLVEMTEFAIKMLDKNPKGYFLLVEAGRIDHGHHENKAYHALHDAVEMNKAVEKAVKITSQEETLLVVTADHSHVFTLGGYANIGNNIFGYSRYPDKNNKKYTTLGYFNGPGAKTPRVEPSEEELAKADYAWQSVVALEMETHGGEDVGIYSSGPQSHLLRGVVEQNYIFHVMDYALCLSENKKNYCEEEGLISSKARHFY